MTDESAPDPAEIEIRSEVAAKVSLQQARCDAYDDGDYDLDDWEGFHCTSCGWRGLSAPMADDWGIGDGDDLLVTQCPECGDPSPETSDEPTQWNRVLEKLVNGPAEIDISRDDP